MVGELMALVALRRKDARVLSVRRKKDARD